MICHACRTENRPEARFCKECGAGLALACPRCRVPHEREQPYCDSCGLELEPASAGRSAPPLGAAPGDVATADIEVVPELRHVSVLFVDLVGFTFLSESRDAEDVRDLLGRYFEQARTIVSRHGGTIQKFIGDAVMAVWGVPVSREDDAERAVRAGLGLVEAVAAFGGEVGAPDLRARAGIVTGQVASLANPGEGLVVGDRVNTAARIQAVAEPGAILVDEVTCQVTSAGIAYEDAGHHVVRGKTEPIHLHRAIRVVAGVAGSRRVEGLEAPLLGRAAELRLLQDLFHAVVDRRTARIVGVLGPAGAGKSRLASELSHYVDGLAEVVLWHTGRCLSYGEGVAYWALAEMVRQRLGIPEDATAGEVDVKLNEGLEAFIEDPSEREEIGAALAVLLASGGPGPDREELFAGWRLFFERLSESEPVVLIFEDMQWADEGLLDFIEELLDFSGGHPIFVCTLARPELAQRRADWPTRVTAGTRLELGSLRDDAMNELLRSLVVGLPSNAIAQIVARSEGIPLYAVEMVRSLTDSGALSEGTDGLVPLRDLGDLVIPASLSSLLESRLDALDPDERELIKAMAVFGGSFPRASAVALANLDEDRIDPVLASLLRKDVLAIRSDPLSPDRGQFAFRQGILRTVAYEMIAKRERRPRHLAAAEHLRESFANDGEEVSEMIATHLLEAYRAGPADQDNGLRQETLAALEAASRRAAAVGAPDAAERALRTAVTLAADDLTRADLTASAGRMAELAGRHEAALELFQLARKGYLTLGGQAEAERLAGPISLALGRLGRHEESIALMREATDSLATEGVDREAATLGCELGRSLLFAGHSEEAAAVIERSLQAAEALEMPDLTCRLLNVKGALAMNQGRYEEARSLFHGAIDIGHQHRVPARASAHGNAADLGVKRDMPDAIEQCEAALATGRQLGNRAVESISIGNLMMARLLAGDWDEVERIGSRALGGLNVDRPDAEDIHFYLGLLAVRRGGVGEAHERLTRVEAWEHGDDVEARQLYVGLAGLIALEEGRVEEALELLSSSARQGIEAHGPSSDGARLAWPDAVVAALALDRRTEAEDLIELLERQPTGLVPPMLRAELQHSIGLLLVHDSDDDAESHLRAAVTGLTDLGYPFWLSRAQVDLGAWLVDRDRNEEASPLLAEADEVMRALKIVPRPDLGLVPAPAQ